MRFDIWSVLLFIFIFQGVFLSISLAISIKKRTNRGVIYLLFVVLALLWYLLEFLFVRNTVNIGLNIFYGTRYGSWFLLGPLTFFYFKSITNREWGFSKSSFLHFIPFFVFTLLIPLFSTEILNQRQVHYGMLSVFDHREKMVSPIQYLYSGIFIAQFIHLAYYLTKNLKLIRLYKERLRSEYAKLDRRVTWLRVLNRTLLLILLFSTVFLYVLLKTDIYRRHMDYIYVLPIGFLFYLIGYYLINADWKEVDVTIAKYAGSSLDVTNISSYVEKLDSLMKNERVYLNNEIRLRDLAGQMGLKTHHLSQLINQHYGLSFFDFINSHRTEEAKKQIAAHPNKLLLQIAFDVGFNNKTSFVNAFKKFEKKTPSNFRDGVLNS